MGVTRSDGTATIGGTEYSLPNASTSLTAQTNTCVLQVFLDLHAMLAGDEFRIRINEKVDGQTQLTVYESYVSGAQGEGWVSPTLVVGDGWDVTVKKIAGTDRALYWSLREIT